MKRMSKNKWVLGGIVAFASIALISTGFAAWQIGQANTTASNNVNVTVDGVTNNTVLLTVTLSDSSITLADTSSISGSYVSSDGKGDLSIAGTIRLEVSPTYLKSNTISKVNFTIDTTDTTTYATNKVTDTTNGNATGFHTGTLSDLTYFDLASTSIAFPTLGDDGVIDTSATTTGWTKANNNGNDYVYTYPISDTSAFFKWGSYFGTNATSVSDFYNSNITTASSSFTSGSESEQLGSLLSNVEKELNAMYGQLNGKTICLKTSLETSKANNG